MTAENLRVGVSWANESVGRCESARARPETSLGPNGQTQNTTCCATGRRTGSYSSLFAATPGSSSRPIRSPAAFPPACPARSRPAAASGSPVAEKSPPTLPSVHEPPPLPSSSRAVLPPAPSAPALSASSAESICSQSISRSSPSQMRRSPGESPCWAVGRHAKDGSGECRRIQCQS